MMSQASTRAILHVRHRTGETPAVCCLYSKTQYRARPGDQMFRSGGTPSALVLRIDLLLLLRIGRTPATNCNFLLDQSQRDPSNSLRSDAPHASCSPTRQCRGCLTNSTAVHLVDPGRRRVLSSSRQRRAAHTLVSHLRTGGLSSFPH